MASADLKPLVAGNWKMNGLAVSEGELPRSSTAAAADKADLMVCPPATLIADFAAAARGSAVVDRRAGLPPRERPAPIPATFPPRCSRMPERSQ